MKKNIISSVSNEKIKLLKKMSRKSVRDEIGQFVVENLIIIHDAMRAGVKPAALFVSADMLKASGKKLQYVLDNTDEFFLINEKINKYFSVLSKPSGIAAIFNKQEKKIDFNNSIIYCNAVSDPGNLGTILRTAIAFDINNVVVDDGCADIYNPKTINAAKDAIFKINISRDENLKLFEKIKSKLLIFAADVKGKVDIKGIGKQSPFCLVLGNEANGVDEQIASQADKLISIKTSGKIESLNVAVSAGIIMHAMWSKKR